jgi:choline-sulfatase
VGHPQYARRCSDILVRIFCALILLSTLACEVVDPVGIRVVLVTLDTLRYDGLLGDGESQMPLLRDRSLSGLRFSRFYSSSSVTQPAHASMLTGLHPWEHGLTRNGQILDEGWTTVPELLRANGFETRAVVSSFPLDPRFGFTQGFDHYDADFDQKTRKSEKPWEKDWQVPSGEFFSLAQSVTEAALDHLESNRSPKQFYWLHYFDPHSPYGVSTKNSIDRRVMLRQVKKGEKTLDQVLSEARALYRADLDYLDRSLARLFDRLAKDEDSFETHIIVISDHGESFRESGSLGHGSRLTREQIHVPALILSPAVSAPGLDSALASSIDIARTLLVLAGLGREYPEVRGRNLLDPRSAPDGVFGMRRTYADGASEEERLDERTYSLEPLWFYAVDRHGNFRRGNGDQLEQPAADIESLGTPDSIKARFRGFERLIAGRSQNGDAISPETRKALEALGYAE